MKEKIYTIPINDAFDKNCECAVCAFMKDEEKKLVEYTVGASMMEPDVREVTNKKGFCKKHFCDIYHTPEKLSCALVTQTHMQEIIKNLKEGFEKAEKSDKGFFKKKDGFDAVIAKEGENLKNLNASCVICSRLDEILEKFMDNLIYLYDTEPEFKQKFINSKGFCIPHFEKLLASGCKNLKGAKKEEFAKKLYEIEISHLERNLGDLGNFIKKFDHRYINTEFENAHDALIRSAQKISGYFED